MHPVRALVARKQMAGMLATLPTAHSAGRHCCPDCKAARQPLQQGVCLCLVSP
jgi:hypothetical protein